MSKAIRMARVSAKGGFNLFWGLAASTIISAVGVILVARLLSPPEYGVVAVALMAPNLIAIFRDWGVNSAMIKYTAQHKSENKTANVRSILAAGLLFELALGLILSLTSLLLSDLLAANVFHRPDIKPLIQVASFTIFAGGLFTAAQSAFTGYEKMELNSIAMVCQSALRTLLAPLLVIFGLGAFGAILGTAAAFLIAGAVSILILYFALYRGLRGSRNDKLEIGETLRAMLRYGLPLSISAILSGFLTQFYNLLIAIYCTDQLIGNYQVAANFAVLITFFVTPITTVLFPAFSKLNAQEEKETLRNVFQFSVKYAALLVVPATSAVIALSQPAVSTIFGEKYSEASLYLALISFSYLYTALGSLSLGNLINSQGKTRFSLKLTLITSAIGFPLSLLLIPRLEIVGLIVTTLTAGIPSLAIGVWWIRKHFTATIDWASSAKILTASTLAAVIAYTAISQLSLPSWITLVIGALIFLAVYVTTAPLIGAIDKLDLQTLRETLKELGPLFYLFNFPLSLIEKLLSTSQKA